MRTNELTTWLSRLGFEDAPHAERTLLRGTLIGLGAALLGVVYEALARTHSGGALPMSLAALALIVALPRHPKWLLVMLAAGTLLTAVVKGLREVNVAFLFAGALSIALALESKWWVRRAISLFAPLFAVGWYFFVVRALGARHLGSAGQALTIIGQLGAGLFLALGVVSAELAVAVDAIEPALRFDAKMRQAWLRLHGALKRLPTGAQQKMHGVAQAVAARWLEAKQEQQEAGGFDPKQAEEAKEAVATLVARLETTEDPELKRHFEQSLRVHRDALEQLDALKRKRERAEARAVAEASWLDTACFTLELAPRSPTAVDEAIDRLAVLATPRAAA
jgi:hypothetical protein